LGGGEGEAGSGMPNASAICGASVMNGEGRATARDRRRRMYQKRRPISNAAPRMPPTTPPAIAPVFELLELVLVFVEVGADVVDVDVDAPGVRSGVSPALSAAVAFHEFATDTSRYAQ